MIVDLGETCQLPAFGRIIKQRQEIKSVELESDDTDGYLSEELERERNGHNLFDRSKWKLNEQQEEKSFVISDDKQNKVEPKQKEAKKEQAQKEKKKKPKKKVQKVGVAQRVVKNMKREAY